MVVGVEEPRGEVGLGPVAVGGAGGHTEVDAFPILTGPLVDQGDALELQGIRYAFDTGIVRGIPARLLHPIAEADGAAGLGIRLGVDQELQVGFRAEWRQCAHGQVQLGQGGLHVSDAPIDGLSFLEQFDAAFAHEAGGVDQPTKVYSAVFYRELGV